MTDRIVAEWRSRDEVRDLIAFTIGYVQPTTGLIGSGFNKAIVDALADRIVQALIHDGWLLIPEAQS